MRIQHNIAALNSYRNLTGNNSAVSKNFQRNCLPVTESTVQVITPAGLAISEKMRAQITGLEHSTEERTGRCFSCADSRRRFDRSSLHAEPYVELADQSANGTYDNAVDRANLQKEIASLKDEINRIADSTNFNGINLLDGSLSTTKLDLAAGKLGGQLLQQKKSLQLEQHPE